MVAWTAIFLSVLSLIINFVANLDKFKAANDEFRSWRKQNKEKKTANNFLKQIAPVKVFSAVALRRSILIYLFLISIISSAVLSLSINQKPVGMTDIVFVLSIYFYSSIIPTIIYLIVLRDLGWTNFIFMIFFSEAIGSWWSLMTMVFLSLGASLFYSGLIAGAITVIILALFTARKRGTNNHND